MDVIFGGKFTGAATGGSVVAILTGQFAQLALADVRQRGRGEEALGHVPEQTGGTTALAPNAESGAIVAHRLVITMPRLGTLGGGAVTGARPTAFRFLLALLMIIRWHKRARVGQTARTLRWGALCLGPTFATLGSGIHRLIVFADESWIAALVLALLLVESTVAFLSRLHDLVATECALRCLETISLRISNQHVQHIRNVAYGTR